MNRSRFRQLVDVVREDFKTHGHRPLSAGFHAVAVHRLGHATQRDTSLTGRLLWTVARVGRVLVTNVYGVELPPDSTVGRRLELPHPQGVVVVPGSVVGDDCLLRHNVTLGLGSAAGGGRPRLGDRVQLGPGASVLGGVTVGDDVLVGPHTLVIEDVPASARVVAGTGRLLPPSPRPHRQIDLTEPADQRATS